MRYFIILCLLSCLSLVQAHEVRPAYIHIQEIETDLFDIRWKQPVRDNIDAVTGLGLQPVFPENCQHQRDSRHIRRPGVLIEHIMLACDGGMMGKTIGVKGLQKTITDIFVRYQPLAGDEINFRLTPAAPAHQISGGGVARLSYFILGVQHLLGGYDHVLFVIGLFLLVGGWRRLVWVITGFTVAHSLTLALSVLDIFRINQAPVEAVIALSILFLAVELTRSPDKRSLIATRFPQSLAFGFGLLHGFGFAGVLYEIGLPQGDTIMALALFNIGLEIGQLIILASCIAIWAFLGKYSRAALTALETIVIWGMGIISSYWLIDRLWSIL